MKPQSQLEQSCLSGAWTPQCLFAPQSCVSFNSYLKTKKKVMASCKFKIL